jgi:hypothetical protein
MIRIPIYDRAIPSIPSIPHTHTHTTVFIPTVPLHIPILTKRVVTHSIPITIPHIPITRSITVNNINHP